MPLPATSSHPCSQLQLIHISQTSVLYICADKSIVRRLAIFIMLDNP